jgi:hypothetical protein
VKAGTRRAELAREDEPAAEKLRERRRFAQAEIAAQRRIVAAARGCQRAIEAWYPSGIGAAAGR